MLISFSEVSQTLEVGSTQNKKTGWLLKSITKLIRCFFLTAGVTLIMETILGLLHGLINR
jgi:hypothetical protein